MLLEDDGGATECSSVEDDEKAISNFFDLVSIDLTLSSLFAAGQ